MSGAPEFSRPVAVARALRLQEHRLAATPAECAALARRFGYLGIERLEAVATLSPAGGGAVRISIDLSADITQACVVTLDPVPEHVVDHSVTEYRPNLSDAEADRLTLEAEEDIVYEPLTTDTIDVAEIVAQQLAVAAGPFPHAPHAAAEPLPMDDLSETAHHPRLEEPLS